MNPRMLKQMMDVALKSGGLIKFDLKTWTEELNVALCGVSNRQALENFKLASSMMEERPHPPPLIASTLLVPGYVDLYEVKKIAEFIASVDTRIPYSLLAFHPHFHMDDLPTTSTKHATRACEAAKAAGLEKVRLGNVHLLGNDY